MRRYVVARRGRRANECDGGQMLHAGSVALDADGRRHTRDGVVLTKMCVGKCAQERREGGGGGRGRGRRRRGRMTDSALKQG
jgi:hypothetical protein